MASLEDRITAPSGGDGDAPTSWADDNGQVDGSTSFAGGSGMNQPVEFEVDVKLIDENSPLYSVKSFEELGLCVYYPVATLCIDVIRIAPRTSLRGFTLCASSGPPRSRRKRCRSC